MHKSCLILKEIPLKWENLTLLVFLRKMDPMTITLENLFVNSRQDGGFEFKELLSSRIRAMGSLWGEMVLQKGSQMTKKRIFY